MRKGAHWPSSGGITMVGKSGLSVWVRSTTSISPEAMAPAKAIRSGVAMSLGSCSRAELALERLGIDRKPGADVLCDVADEEIFQPLLQCAHHRPGERRGRHLRWLHRLVPFGLERTE